MKLLSWFFPNRCPFCGRVIGRVQRYCEVCGNKLPVVPDNVCRICGVEKGRCVCRKRRYPCTRRIAPFYYEGVARSGILRFKKQGRFGGYRQLATFLAEHIAVCYDGVTFDELVCVPASGKTKKKRGYSQTLLLAREVSRLTGIPLNQDRLCQLFENRPQKGMSRADRIGNVAGVFDVRNPETVAGKGFLLIDDVITTGATVNECAKMLRIFGATYVYAAAVCVGKPPKDREKKKT